MAEKELKNIVYFVGSGEEWAAAVVESGYSRACSSSFGEGEGAGGSGRKETPNANSSSKGGNHG